MGSSPRAAGRIAWTSIRGARVLRSIATARAAGGIIHPSSQAPDHYGWKNEARIEAIETAMGAAQARLAAPSPPAAPEEDIRTIIRELDAEGRWISTYMGQRLVGQPKFKPGERYLASEVFVKNLETLSDCVAKSRHRPTPTK